MTTATELQIAIESKILQTNFSEWKEPLLATIAAANKVLQTDEDFVEAEQNIKALQASEKALTTAKDEALKKAEDVFKLFADIDEVSGSARDARLSLQKQIKTRKDGIKQEAVEAAVSELQECIMELHPAMIKREAEAQMKQARAHIEDAAKGKRTVATMQKAIEVSVSVFAAKFAERSQAISVNMEIIEARAETHPALFEDKEALACTLKLEELKTTIQERLDKYEIQEEAKRKAAQAQENELALRRKLDADKSADQAEAPQQDAPADGVKQVAATIAQPMPSEDSSEARAQYQISILVGMKAGSDPKSLARAIRDKYGPIIDGIELHNLSAVKAA